MVWAPPTPVQGRDRGWKSGAVKTLKQTLGVVLNLRLPHTSLESHTDPSTDRSERLLHGGRSRGPGLSPGADTVRLFDPFLLSEPQFPYLKVRLI